MPDDVLEHRHSSFNAVAVIAEAENIRRVSSDCAAFLLCATELRLQGQLPRHGARTCGAMLAGRHSERLKLTKRVEAGSLPCFFVDSLGEEIHIRLERQERTGWAQENIPD